MKWNHVPQGFRNGILDGYKVKYGQTFSNGSYSEVKFLTVFEGMQRHTLKATLTDLEKDTEYRIEVAGVTDGGIGVFSEPIIAQTCKFKIV